MTMIEHGASRTLVKSGPELWAQCSDARSLGRHLGAFGEIRITKLEPETAVAWEGDEVRGTVTLEPSGWGTRVVITAELPPPAAGVGERVGDVTATHERDPIAEPEPARPGFLRRLFGGLRRPVAPVSDPVPEVADDDSIPTAAASPVVRATPVTAEPAEPDSPSAQALIGALDSLGRAHRRPFSHG